MKVRAFFSRRTPFYLMSAQETTDSGGFDAYPCEVNATDLLRAQHLRMITDSMEELFRNNPAPEEVVQSEADRLCELLGDHSGIE